jgi:hypothetical protein
MRTSLLFLLTLAFTSCIKKEDPVMCTMEFRTVGLQVTGKTLSDFYTIRLATGDTIRLQDQGGVFEEFYPVLDDSFQQKLQDKIEAFQFIGLINDTIRVDEVFIISADKCHINKQKGSERVDL